MTSFFESFQDRHLEISVLLPDVLALGFVVVVEEACNFIFIVLSFGVVDGEHAHKDVGRVGELARLHTQTLKVFHAILCITLIHDVAICHED